VTRKFIVALLLGEGGAVDPLKTDMSKFENSKTKLPIKKPTALRCGTLGGYPTSYDCKRSGLFRLT